MDIKIRYSRTIQVRHFEPVSLEMEAVGAEEVSVDLVNRLMEQVDRTLEDHVSDIRLQQQLDAGGAFIE